MSPQKSKDLNHAIDKELFKGATARYKMLVLQKDIREAKELVEFLENSTAHQGHELLEETLKIAKRTLKKLLKKAEEL